MSTITPFNVLQCPLEGSNLLEASAGTGKTFSLVFLYMRLLLEKGLSVNEILVATFTNAATAEISERIYQQLSIAASIAHDINAGNEEHDIRGSYPDQALLIDWLLSLIDASDEPLANRCDTLQKRIRLAQAQFDEAVIRSIDGFALQQLTEHVDIVQSYVPQDIITDNIAIISRIYFQLAKHNFIALGDDMAAIGEAVATMTSTELFSLLDQMITHYDELKNTEADIFRTSEQQQRLIHKAITSDHHKAVELIRQAIDESILHKTSYKHEKLDAFAAQLSDVQAYCGGRKSEKFLAFFSSSAIAAKTLKNKTFDGSHELFDIFDELYSMHDTIIDSKTLGFYSALMCLAATIKEHIDVVKSEQMVLTFADITQRVSDVAHRIPTPLKAALIDEAQDTNTHQLEMFQRMFMCSKTNDSLAATDKICFFVGDPKQAIYGFRGANIYSYLRIQELVDYRYELTTNYRSSSSLNESINYLFSGNVPFIDSRISYRHIASQKDDNESSFAQQSLSLIESPSTHADDLAATAAHALHTCINAGVQISGRALALSDIAILVRSGTQAEKMKTALAQYGIAASFVSQKSVYASTEARLMLGVLRVIAEDNVRLLRSLMLTALFDCSVDDVCDDDYVNTMRSQFQHFFHEYNQRGFAVMFYRMMNDFSIAGNLLVAADGRRRLTNFIQLFELLQTSLQEQSLSLPGLCDWLTQQIHTQKGESELRLEDDNAVTIMTFHKSKGLEFPVVCLPFFDYHSNRKDSGHRIVVSHNKGKAALSSLNYEGVSALVNEEENAEARRLAYVALTRAKYCNIVVIQPLSDKGKESATKKASMFSALKSTLTVPEGVKKEGFVHYTVLPELPAVAASVAEIPHYRAQEISTNYESSWLLDSFSRLLYAMHSNDSISQVTERLPPASDMQDLTPTALMQFPAGPRAGTALHEIYEHYMEHRQADTMFTDAIELIYAKHLPDYPSLPSAHDIAKAIVTTASVILPPHDFCLRDIEKTQQSIEMKFFMHLSAHSRQQLYRGFGHSITTDSEGFVHGYIDYMFCYKGKFYVVDYKSNKIGDTVADYHYENMQAEMAAHHYDQQALIYTLALCKHLAISSEESYVNYIGGYMYLFIRGITNETAHNGLGVYANTIPWEAIEGLLA